MRELRHAGCHVIERVPKRTLDTRSLLDLPVSAMGHAEMTPSWRAVLWTSCVPSNGVVLPNHVRLSLRESLPGLSQVKVRTFNVSQRAHDSGRPSVGMTGRSPSREIAVGTRSMHCRLVIASAVALGQHLPWAYGSSAQYLFESIFRFPATARVYLTQAKPNLSNTTVRLYPEGN